MDTRTNKGFLHRWEIALLLALCITMLAGLWAGREQQMLSDGLIRLHVIAASDGAADQALKLQVRDAVLARLTPVLDAATTPDEAQAVIHALLPELETLATSTAGQPAVAALGWEHYPTRVYEGFALPAGDYLSLRLELGAAQGRNWWCVVFPPLCAAAVEDAAALDLLLDEETAALITGKSGGYVLKFRLMELWGQLRTLLD